MKKITLLLVLLLTTSLHVGCGSSSDKEEGDTASADAESGEGGEEAADGEEVAEGDEAVEGEEVAEGEEATDEAGGEGGEEVVADLGEGSGDEAALPEEGGDAPAADTAGAVADNSEVPQPETPLETVPEPVAEPIPVAEEPAPIPSSPYLKIKDTPYNSNGRLLNTVYLARPGDNINDVATKLYGSADRKKDLVGDNPILKRGVKPGDKIYFQSSRRPDDASTMMTYYEDKGVPPQIYVTKEGDNIRNFSKDLLGHPQAWKEVWATNLNIESKDTVPPGIELKYWPADTAAGGGADTAGGDVAALPQEPPVASEPPPPPPMDMAQNDIPPPPPPADIPPPPPMDDPMAGAGILDAAPPPPPPPPPKKGGMEAMGDKETTMALGVAAVLLIAAAGLFAVIMRRGRSKKIKLSQTQV